MKKREINFATFFQNFNVTNDLEATTPPSAESEVIFSKEPAPSFVSILLIELQRLWKNYA